MPHDQDNSHHWRSIGAVYLPVQYHQHHNMLSTWHVTGVTSGFSCGKRRLSYDKVSTSVCRSQGLSSLVVGYSGNYQCGVWRHSIKQSEPRHLILFNNKISLIPAQVTTERDKQSLLSAGPITDIYFNENFFILFILIP